VFDQVVVRDDVILEKPSTPKAAFDMLRSLSGRSHQVVTALILIFHADAEGVWYAEPRIERHVESTDVEFLALSDELIEAYVATGDPMDKAGAYGVQSLAASLVSGLHGDYYNVVGFPLSSFARVVQAWASPSL
jgi:septum formation protein